MVIVANKNGLGGEFGEGFADRFAVDGISLVLASMDAVVVSADDEWDDSLMSGHEDRIH